MGLTREEKLRLYELLKERAWRKDGNRLADYRPYPKQIEFHAAGGPLHIRERLLKAGNQLGKALRHGTRVLTPTGWAAIESLQVGDHVVAGDGSATEVIGVYPQGLVDLYRVTFDQGEWVDCCGEHLWTALPPAARFDTRWSHGAKEANPRHGKWEVLSTQQMLSASGPAPKPRRRFLTPFSGVWQLAPQPTTVDPYVLGLLIGDGCMRNGVSLSTVDAELLDAMRAEAERYGLVLNGDGRCSWRAAMPGGKGARGLALNKGNRLKDDLERLGLLGKLAQDKFVPKPYLWNTPDVRLAVLQGLMDTDGSIAVSGAVEFGTTSKRLAQDVETLVHSFGGKCKTIWRATTFTYKGEKKAGRPSARLRIRLPHVPLFRLQRKLARVIRPVSTTDHRVVHAIEPTGSDNATCIRVAHDSATFVIEHGIVTHNTFSAGAEHAMHLTGRYPDWWCGATFDDAVVGWAASETSQSTRDTVQRILLGQPGQWGTGAIPRDAIIETKRSAHGVADAVETILVRHGGGGDIQAGQSRVTIKTYDQGRERWQGETLDFVWFDEEPPEDIYFEGLTRTNAKQGIVTLTFTPLKGMSQVVRRFLQEKPAGSVVVNMTINDAQHYTPEQREAIIASYPAHEREARVNGTPTLGSGRIFPLPDEAVAEAQISIPRHWPRICGLDFGWDHPTAAVWIAWDRDNDVVHVYDCHRLREATPAVHSVAIKSRGEWIPVAWPHDGEQTDKGSGVALANQYRAHGVAMLPDKATHAPDKAKGQKEGDGGNGVEAGIMDMLERMQTGRLRVARHLQDWFEEFRLYHRESGKIVKVQDDLLSATRYAIMMLRHAKTPKPEKQGPKQARFSPLDHSVGML